MSKTKPVTAGLIHASLMRRPLKLRARLPGTFKSGYQVAELTGLSRSHVNRVLRRTHHARFDTAIKIAAAMGITVSQFAELVYAADSELQEALKKIKDAKEQGEARRAVGLTAPKAASLKATKVVKVQSSE